MRIDLSCPLDIKVLKLPNDENSKLLIRFRNISEADIQGAMVAFFCFDKTKAKIKTQLENIVFDEKIPKYEEKELEIEGLPLGMEKLDFKLERAYFLEGEPWSYNEESLISYDENKVSDERKLAILQELAGDDALSYPEDKGAFWLCVCSKPNKDKNQCCAYCGRNKHDVFTGFNQSVIEQEYSIILQAEEDERRRQNELVLEEEKRIREEKKKKTRKLRLALVLALSVFLALGIGYASVFWIIPEYRYSQAAQRLQLGAFDDAKQGFLNLKGYKNSPDMALECDYQLAKSLIRSGTTTSLRNAEGILTKLKSYKDSIELVLETKLMYAEKVFISGEFEEAIGLYSAIDDARADKKIKEVKYAWAKNLMANLKYDSAREKLLELKDYKDSALVADECILLPASAALEQKDYEKAIVLYGKLPERQDALLKLPEIYYLWGDELYSKGDYELAAEKFLAAGAYRDAYRRATEALYKPAMERFKNKDFKSAKSMFDKILDFKDSKRYSMLSSIEIAKGLIEEKSFKEALVYLEDAKAMREADELKKQVSFLVAEEYFSNNDFINAELNYKKAGDFDGASEKMHASIFKQASLYFKNGDFENASAYFSRLPEGYSNAELMKKQSLLAYSKQLLEKGEAAKAREGFLALGDFEDARESYNASMYSEAKAAIEKGDSSLALSYLIKIPDYKDSKALFNDFTYKAASKIRDEGDLQKASELFMALGDYLDSKEQASELKQNYFDSKYRLAVDSYHRQSYKRVIELLEGMDFEELKGEYSNLKDIYTDSMYHHADELYDEDKPYEAYALYKSIEGYKDVKTKKLTRYPYLLIGNWVTSKKTEMSFFEDGRCIIDGKEMFYIAGRYRLSTGESLEKLKYSHKIVKVEKNSLTLQSVKPSITYKLKRVK